jgi:hypothetical protein
MSAHRVVDDYMLHEDRAAGILAHTFPYRRGLRELSLGLMVVHVPPEEQTGYRITDHDRRNLLEYCASELGFPSLDHSAADGAIALSVWYGDAHIYQVSRCLADLGLDLPLLRGETAVQLWYDIARDDYRNPPPSMDSTLGSDRSPCMSWPRTSAPQPSSAARWWPRASPAGSANSSDGPSCTLPPWPSNPSCSSCGTTCATRGRPATGSPGRSTAATASTPSRFCRTRRA